jgi:hypothetical protein
MQTNSVRILPADNPDLRISVSSAIEELEVRSDHPNRFVPALAQPIEASFAKPDLYAPTRVSISASVIEFRSGVSS